MMFGKQFKDNLRKILIGVLLLKVSAKLCILKDGNPKKILRKKFL